MIEKEPSDTFTLKNATIVFDSITDKAHASIGESPDSYTNNKENFVRKDTIVVDKKLNLTNIFFTRDFKTYKFKEQFFLIKFNKKVTFTNCFLRISNCLFKEHVRVEFNPEVDDMYLSYYGKIYWLQQEIKYSSFKNSISLSTDSPNNSIINAQFYLMNSKVWPNKDWSSRHFISANYFSNLWIKNSIFYGDGSTHISSRNSKTFDMESNDFTNNELSISFANTETLEFVENSINTPTSMLLGAINPESNLDWNQFKNGVYNYWGFDYYIRGLDSYPKDPYQTYLDSIRFTKDISFKLETKLLGKLKQLYNDQHDKEYENAVFMKIKNLETKRLEYLYHKNPSFDAYFKWKVNQFLKVFSAYGTEPTKAITFSVYVIFFFALIYLFFPNHWDSHGKNRIMDRYRFFTKYMNKEAGIHDVYLEEQQEELLASEDFKTYMQTAEKHIPKFFIATAMPLYKWSVSGTQLSASLLKRVDIMKGTWNELPQSKRIWKSALLIGAFLIAILYDIFIKILNALMLSINTFTTLGFGEIPIKGLPRYLAIIQGFIGWFMLTIFSVSLISQLLN
jgi:hypothetical protein